MKQRLFTERKQSCAQKHLRCNSRLLGGEPIALLPYTNMFVSIVYFQRIFYILIYRATYFVTLRERGTTRARAYASALSSKRKRNDFHEGIKKKSAGTSRSEIAAVNFAPAPCYKCTSQRGSRLFIVSPPSLRRIPLPCSLFSLSLPVSFRFSNKKKRKQIMPPSAKFRISLLHNIDRETLPNSKLFNNKRQPHSMGDIRYFAANIAHAYSQA